ncbi:MAG TPA: endolytic transglycosylase MltG [Gammaproteobacteria bacterium]|nr:endolytic transglycosylase MltG [Gammaproteobacteria bacterium]
MRRLAVLVAGAGLALAGAWLAARHYLDTPLLTGTAARIVNIEPGASLTASAESMAAQGVLDHPRVFAWYARLRGDGRSIQAGEYSVAPGTTPRALLDQLVSGRVLLHSLTVVEGWTFRELLAALHAQPAVARTLGESDGAAVMAALGEPGRHPEGLFFPETYHFPRGTSDLDLLRQARALMDEQLAGAWAGRAADLPFETSYEALILASIVEKETALEAERPLIAGVFVRRLERGMRLQTDPSVIYGIGDGFDGDIRRRDLDQDTPYNTYTRAGLPPTPIALPGAASLAAVMHPADGETLYFVATGAGDGSHYFSTTLEEHNEAVRRFLARQGRQ